MTFFTVNTFLDTVDANPGDGNATDANGQTSLRAAIMEANALGGSHQIELQGGTYNLTQEGSEEDGALTGDLDAIADVTIFGSSSFSTLTTVIDAQHIDRVFDIRPGGRLVLEEIELRGGDLRGRGDGGGIQVSTGGTLEATNVAIIENLASNGGGISNNGGSVTITGSVLANNHAEGGLGFSQGGAVDSNGGTVDIQESTIHDNRAQSVGGGIAVSVGTLTVTNSTIAQNSAGDAQMSSGDGGGIYIQSSVTATLLASTVAFNSVGNQGGGIWTAGSLTIERTLLSNNMAGSGPEGFIDIATGSVTSNGHNLVREDTSFNFTPATGDLIGTSASPVEPNLLGLANNGGFTPTISLGGGSPAIDAGPSLASPLFQDQRGFPRERSGIRGNPPNTDIGAFEVLSPSDFFVEDDPADFLITNDQGSIGTLDAGDTVTFDPGGANIAGLIFGDRAFTTISAAVAAARASEVASGMGEGDQFNEVVLGNGDYIESVTLDVPNLLLRGHTGVAADTTILALGSNFGIEVTANGVQINSLNVTGTTTAGIEVNSFGVSTFQASNIRVEGNSGDGVHIVGGPSDFLEVQIRDSVFSGNGFSGLAISNVDSVELSNVTADGNGASGGDGISISNAFETALDSVTVNNNLSRGFHFSDVGPLLLRDPRTSNNTSGNLFNNVSVLAIEPVAESVSNSVTVTGTEIQFDAGAGMAQQALTLGSVVSTVQITAGGGNDMFAVDYVAGNPPTGRQLFLDGGTGTDQILTTNDAHHQLTDHLLSIAAVDEVNILGFEQASITGGAGANKLDATEFEGEVTLDGVGGDDTLEGTVGDDLLIGGNGNDVLLGGPLDDQYVIGDTTFEVLDLNDGETFVTTILDDTDTEVAMVNLGTDFFRFNDVQHGGDSLFVSPSGLISFNGPVDPQNNFDLDNVPESVNSIPIIAPLFDDWVTGVSDFPGLTFPDGADPSVLVKFEDTGGATGNERLIIEWNDVFHRDQIVLGEPPTVISGASPVTFQLILELNTFDRDGDITFNYVDLNTGTGFENLANGASATVGGKDGGDNPLGVRQLSFNQQTPFIGDSKAVRARVGLSDGDDRLFGDDGDDVLVTSSGRDTLDGGSAGETAVGDTLFYDGLRNRSASDHQVNQFAVESKIFDESGRSYEFTAEYANFEALDLRFGPADQNITVDPNGLPPTVSIDTRGPLASDTVTILGTALSAPSPVGLFDGIYSGSYAGNYFVSGVPAGSIPDGGDFPGDVTASISEGAITVTEPDPGAGTVDSGGNISFLSPGQLMGADYTVSFSGTLTELAGDVSGGGTWTIQPNASLITGSGTWAIDRDSGAPIVSDGVDNFVLSGTTLSVGTTTIDLAGVEDLVLDLSSGGADTVSVDQTFSGSARNLQIVGDTADDSVSVQSINKPQFANLFASDGYVVSLVENFTGSLSHEEVLINGGGDGSGNTITNQLDPDQLIVSPDGTRVYVAAANSNSLVVYDRDRVTGDLTFVESLVNSGMDFQGGTIAGLSGPSSVIVSADGRNVYVASEGDRTIAHFVHHPGDTQLTFISSTIFDDMGSVFNIDLPFGMVFTPEQSVLIVTSETGNLVAFLEVTSSGELVAKGVLTDGGFDSSGSTRTDKLGGASSIAISPDGRHLYVTGATDNSVSVFDTPVFDDEQDSFILPLLIQQLDSGSPPASVFGGASSVTVSPDGGHVYVTGRTGNSIVVLSRNSVTGELSFVESLINGGMDEVGNTVQNLLGPTAMTIGPDGFKVYVAAAGSDSVTVFERDLGTGVLTFSESLFNGGVDAGGTTISGVNNVSGVFASADGRHVYASGSDDNAVVRFNVPGNFVLKTDGAAAISLTTSNFDDQISLGIDGQPATVTINSGGSGDNDQVNVFGDGTDNTVNVNGGVVTFGSTMLTLTSTTALTVNTDAGNDTVNVTASMTGPQLFVDGGAHTTGDVLSVDPLTSVPTDTGTQVTFTDGFQSLSYADIETVVIQTAPTPVISSSESDPTNAATIPVSVDFGEPVTGFDQGDVSVSGGTISNFVDATGGVFTFDLTPSGDGTITVDIAAAAAADLAANASLVATQFTIVSDRTAPTPVISSSDADPTNSATIPVSVSFGESMTGFDQGDLSVSGGTISNFVDATGGVFTFDVTPSGDGTITVDIAATVAEDLAGNDNLLATQFSIVSDRTSPTPVISSSDSDPTNSATIPVSVAFGESMTAFDQGDLSVSGGTISNFVDGGSGVFTFDVTPSGDGTITVDIAATVAEDLAGNDNLVATQFSIVSDRTAPTPVITSSESDPTNSATIPVSVDFGESMTGFDQGDLSVSGGTISNFVDGEGGVFTFDVTSSGDGTITVDIAATVAEDLAGNDNLVATQFSLVSDRTSPAPVISSSDSDPTNSATIPFSVTFDEPVTGFVRGGLSVIGGTTSNFMGTGAGPYTFDVTPFFDFTIRVGVNASAATDLAGNSSLIATEFRIVSDRTAPTPVISTTESSPTNLATIPFSVNFGESMTGFTQGDISVNGGTVKNFSDGGGGVFTFGVTPMGNGTITVNIAAAVATDLAGNDNQVATQLSIVSDRPLPPAGAVFDDAVDSGFGTLVGASASLDNGPGDGTVEIPAVDAYGQFETAFYDPVGDDEADTTFDSEVYFRFGNSGARQSLIDASGSSGSSIRSLSDEANSSFLVGNLDFALTQTLEPVFDDFGNQNGTLLTQTYRIQNLSEIDSQTFELVRYLDGDLDFDGSIVDGGGRLQLPTGEDLLFETDQGTTPDTTTAFLGITGFGGTIPETARFQIEGFGDGLDEVSVLQAAIINGASLTDSLSNVSESVDINGDQFIDPGLEFDVTLALANTFALGASQSTIYTTHTFFGSDSPRNATSNTAPTIGPKVFNVDENSDVGTVVGTVLADDMETPSSLTFAITGGDPDGFFAVAPSTGQITIARPDLDHEASDVINLTVEVTDPGSLSASTTVTVNVNDLNEAPVFDAIDDQAAFVDELLAFTVTAMDPDAPPSGLIFSLESEVPGVMISPDGDVTFTPNSGQLGQTFSITVNVFENIGDPPMSASETFSISVLEIDFGDAPDSYGTTLANDGPRHGEGTLFLGDAFDTEVDGQPDTMALGDDNNPMEEFPVDDEDGITFLSALSVGTTRLFRVSASEAGFLDAWIDFDQSGDFSASENLSSAALLIPGAGSVSGSGGTNTGGGSGGGVISSGSIGGGGNPIGGASGGFSLGTGIAVPAGFSTVSFDIPNNAMTGDTFARFRLSSTGGLAPTGLAGDGEVEDHLVEIVAAPVGNSDSLEAALDTAVDAFFDAFPDELNDPDPTVTGDELPLAVQAEGGAEAERTDGDVELDVTDPLLRVVIQAINDVVNRLEEDRAADENIFVLALHPVDFLLTDPQGRTVGFTKAGGTVNEIGADATFTGDGVVELLTIRNADPGGYGLQLVGVGGVFRGGASLITPAGTQQITFQGSLAQSDDVQLALTYQEGLASFPTRTDIESVDFSEIADFVAQIPTAESDAKTLVAGATEALASIALDRLDASLFSNKEDEAAALERLLVRISETRKKLLDAIKTSLDEDELESLKLVFDDEGEDPDSVEALARVLLEKLRGPLISAPRQVKELSGTLQQLLDQLREQKENQQKQKDNQQPAPSNDAKGATKPEAEDKRTSQRSPAKTSATVVNSSFIVSTDAVAKRRRVDQASGTTRENGSFSVDRQFHRESSADAASQPTDSQAEVDQGQSPVPVKE